MRREVDDHLDHLDPRLWWERGEVRLGLTVSSNDLWLAVLVALAAVTQTGYPVHSLVARPANR